MRTMTPRHRDESGIALIEVLISLLIFSLGILGLVGLQANASKISYDAEDRSRASLMANEIISDMWTKKTSTPSTTAWQSRVADTTISGLPEGVGTISAPDVNNVVTVTITWRAPSRKAADLDSKYITKVAIQ